MQEFCGLLVDAAGLGRGIKNNEFRGPVFLRWGHQQQNNDRASRSKSPKALCFAIPTVLQLFGILRRGLVWSGPSRYIVERKKCASLGLP